jgi:AmmeMemoRadiSam system protein A
VKRAPPHSKTPGEPPGNAGSGVADGVSADPSAHPLIRLALQAIRDHVAGRDPQQSVATMSPVSPPQACFVSLKIRGRLRGCIGTLASTQPSLEAEIVANAVASSTRDPRFPAVRAEEIDSLEISLDLLSPPEPVASPAQLDPHRYGVIVRATGPEGGRSGVLLPDLPGVDSAARQIAICRDKAGIAPNAPVTLERFTVVRIGAQD